MIHFAEKVVAYTAGLDQQAFVASSLVYDATVRNLELIGEAATHVPDAIRAAHPNVPWRLVVATRNRLIHGYLGIDVIVRPRPSLTATPVRCQRAGGASRIQRARSDPRSPAWRCAG